MNAVIVVGFFGLLILDNILQDLDFFHAFSDLGQNNKSDHLRLELDKIELKLNLIERLDLKEVRHVLEAEGRGQVPKILRHLLQVFVCVQVLFDDCMAHSAVVYHMVPFRPLCNLKSQLHELAKFALNFENFLVY